MFYNPINSRGSFNIPIYLKITGIQLLGLLYQYRSLKDNICIGDRIDTGTARHGVWDEGYHPSVHCSESSSIIISDILSGESLVVHLWADFEQREMELWLSYGLVLWCSICYLFKLWKMDIKWATILCLKSLMIRHEPFL